MRRADRHADDADSASGVSMHPLAEPLLQAVGGAEDAALAADVLAEQTTRCRAPSPLAAPR